jgi:hypothetical protein
LVQSEIISKYKNILDKGEAIEEKLKLISENVIFAPRASTQQRIMNGMT